jgi:hypothetical protein
LLVSVFWSWWFNKRVREREKNQKRGAPLASVWSKKKIFKNKKRTLVHRRVRRDRAHALGHDVRDGLVPRGLFLGGGGGGGGDEGGAKIEELLLLAAAAGAKRLRRRLRMRHRLRRRTRNRARRRPDEGPRRAGVGARGHGAAALHHNGELLKGSDEGEKEREARAWWEQTEKRKKKVGISVATKKKKRKKAALSLSSIFPKPLFINPRKCVSVGRVV